MSDPKWTDARPREQGVDWEYTANRLRSILTHITTHGIHTDRVDAQITMSLEDQKLDLVEVLTREINRSKPQKERSQ